MTRHAKFTALGLVGLIGSTFLIAPKIVLAQDSAAYQKPGRVLEELLLAPLTPSVAIDENGRFLLLATRQPYPSVAELARPELRIAGLRLDPGNFGPSRSTFSTGVRVRDAKTGDERPVVGLPTDLRGGGLVWNRSRTRAALSHTLDNRIDLYEIDVANARARKVNKRPLNLVLGVGYSYLDDDTLLYLTAPKPATSAPPRPEAPDGPVIQQNLGKSAASRTYQDLIKSAHDEQLFAFYARAVPVINRQGNEMPLAPAGLYARVSPSPDNRYFLVETVEKPFSYLVPSGGFPSAITILDRQGKTVKALAKSPSSETAPIGFDNIPDAPFAFGWRADLPATLVWAKPLDGGLAKNPGEFRDALLTLAAPFDSTPRELVKTRMRFRGVTWGNKNLALVTEGLSARQRVRTLRLDPETGATTTLIERGTNDAYSDPGSPLLKDNAFGRSVLQTLENNRKILLAGAGASPKGNLPFLSTMDLETGKSEILWRCDEGFLESVVQIVDPEKKIFVTTRQSGKDVPNYFLHDLSRQASLPLTRFSDPQPQLRGVQKQKIRYKRRDGLDLTATVYLPPGYDPKRDGRLPVLMWAYPREFKSAADAGQVRGSDATFTRVSSGSPVFFVLRGFAVMDETEFPIVGEGESRPNDTFISQLVANAEAAIDAIDSLGIGDRNRVAVGGHSYGAFMTANLLAHTRLFKAGIARSGAYNRTLTPFGFQNEDRTYWQAPDLYNAMSPFSSADKIKDALLLIHGDSDNNPGTFPIQSERLYNAVKGHGGTVRYVSLPFESHGYAGRENLLHMLWEMDTWLATYVKGSR